MNKKLCTVVASMLLTHYCPRKNINNCSNHL